MVTLVTCKFTSNDWEHIYFVRGHVLNSKEVLKTIGMFGCPGLPTVRKTLSYHQSSTKAVCQYTNHIRAFI